MAMTHDGLFPSTHHITSYHVSCKIYNTHTSTSTSFHHFLKSMKGKIDEFITDGIGIGFSRHDSSGTIFRNNALARCHVDHLAIVKQLWNGNSAMAAQEG